MDALEQLLHKKPVNEDDTVLAKLEALISRDNHNSTEKQEQSLLSKLNALLDKASKRTGDSPPREINTARLAAYAASNNGESSQFMRELRRMEERMEGRIEEKQDQLYRRLDA